MWLIAAFAATGFLIGNLMALSATSTISSVLGLLFALFGGSLVAFLGKLSGEDRTIAGKLSFALCTCCLIGVYGGIFVREGQLLTPRERRFQGAAIAHPADKGKDSPSGASAAADLTKINGPYLAGQLTTDADHIDSEFQHGDITASNAYSALLASVRKREAQGSDGK